MRWLAPRWLRLPSTSKSSSASQASHTIQFLRFPSAINASIMPRILSQPHSFCCRQRRRRSSQSQSSQSSQSSQNSVTSNIQSAILQLWPIKLQASPDTSPSSSTSSSSTSLGSLSEHTSQTQSRSYQGSQRGGTSWTNGNDGDDGPWGQFIDTAEAEEEIVRHSRILSKKRYSM
jgi:hypothetical protein